MRHLTVDTEGPPTVFTVQTSDMRDRYAAADMLVDLLRKSSGVSKVLPTVAIWETPVARCRGVRWLIEIVEKSEGCLGIHRSPPSLDGGTDPCVDGPMQGLRTDRDKCPAREQTGLMPVRHVSGRKGVKRRKYGVQRFPLPKRQPMRNGGVCVHDCMKAGYSHFLEAPNNAGDVIAVTIDDHA